VFVFKFLAVLVFAFIVPISHATEQAPVPDIEFLDQTYSQAWRSDPTPEYSKSECHSATPDVDRCKPQASA